MPLMRWTAPPTRRELTLLLFSLTVFVVSYNLETSLGLIGVSPQKLTSSYLSSIGLGTKDPGFEVDGRRPKPWRDELEDVIVGDWDWREGEVSGVPRGHAASSGSGRDAMIYDAGSNSKTGRNTRKQHGAISLDTGVTVKDQFIKWGKNVPRTRVVAHTPGYTILENVIIVNGTLLIVADDWMKVPKPADIASSSLDRSRPPRVQDLHIITGNDASEWFGPYAAKIHGTSWLATDPAESQDPYLLLSLFRTHASLMSSAPSSSFTTSSGLHIIPPSSPTISANSVSAPLRLILPHVPTFSTPHIPPRPGEDVKVHPPPRERAYLGFHPLLPQVVLPTLNLWFEEDWKDLADMHVPFLLERVVLADRGASERGRAQWQQSRPSFPESSESDVKKRSPGEEGEPIWAAPFIGLQAPDGWWAPMRSALLRYLHIPDDSVPNAAASTSEGGGFWGRKKQPRRPVVSYVSMQEQPHGAGPRLSGDDHLRLVRGLEKLVADGVLGEVHVLNGNGSVPAPEWIQRMGAIARSTIVMGPSGHHLADSIFMRAPVPQAPTAADGTDQKGATAKAAAPPMLMEFFPPGQFVRDQQYAMQALNLDYMAWWNDRKFSSANLPDVSSQPSSSPREDEQVPIDVDAILRVVREEAPRRVQCQ